MHWERITDGYLMRAEGCDGRVIEERPLTFILDGQERSGLGGTAVFSRPDPHTIQGEAKQGGSRCREGQLCCIGGWNHADRQGFGHRRSAATVSDRPRLGSSAESRRAGRRAAFPKK
jgi:hypothetical protein